MNAAVLSSYEVEDVEYLRHGDKPLLARIYKPKGAGPFPMVIDLHGGAWCKKDRTSDAGTDEPLARSGVGGMNALSEALRGRGFDIVRFNKSMDLAQRLALA